MAQRVSIQYSIELDQLETEAERLFMGIQKQISDLHDSTQTHAPLLSMEAIDSLSTLQQYLQNISISVDDLQKIISGYMSFKLQPEGESPAPQEETSSDSQISDLSIEERDVLREQLSEYRKVLAHATSLHQPDPEIVDEELKRQKIESFKQKQSSSVK